MPSCVRVRVRVQLRNKLMRLRVGPDLRRQFQRFDTSGAGALTPAQLRKVLLYLGMELSSLELRQLVAKLDSNRTGRITYVD